MDTFELNLQQKTSKRDGWSVAEKIFFLERYNLYSGHVGKKKRLATRMNMFDFIAEEMAVIGSSKTGRQVSSHFYTLTRTSIPKIPKQLPIIDLSDVRFIATNEASFISIDETSKEPLRLEINTDLIDGTIIDRNAASSVNYNEESPLLFDGDSAADITKNPKEPTIVNSASTIQMIEKGNESITIMSADVNTASNPTNIQPEKTSIGILSAYRRNYEIFSRFSKPSRSQQSSNVGIATVYNTNGISNDNGNSSGASLVGTSASSNCVESVLRITGAANAVLPSISSTADSSSFARITQSATSSQCCNSTSSLASISTTQHLPPLSRASTSLSLRNSTNNDDWTDDETKWLLDQYGYYMDDVGAMKLFRNNNALWEQLAKVLSEVFGKKRSTEELSKRVKTVIDQKKAAVERNRKCGSIRVNVAYEEEISRIAAMDDSIEPEVLRDANGVDYKQTSKKRCGSEQKSECKKPRWDKPTKKGVCNDITTRMASMHQRRGDSEKAKEEHEKERNERRTEMHSTMMETLRSIKRPEN